MRCISVTTNHKQSSKNYKRSLYKKQYIKITPVGVSTGRFGGEFIEYTVQTLASRSDHTKHYDTIETRYVDPNFVTHSGVQTGIQVV